MKKLLVIFILALAFTNLSIVEAETKPYFKNVGVHDPSIIKDNDTYYIFGTHGAAAKSSDLKSWDYIANGDISNHPQLGNIKENMAKVFEWSGNKDQTDIGAIGIWAPDVYYNENYLNPDGSKGAYLMYFSISTGSDDGQHSHLRSLIGLMRADDIEGPYEFVENVIYTGFHNQDGKSSFKNTDFNDYFPNTTPRSDYFNLDGTYNFNMYPNAIDPAIVETHDDKLYMVYGSWHAGIWVLELDKATGLPKRNTSYTYDDAVKNVDPYFGAQISGGYWTSGEGPYIRYHEKSGYYHLYVTYGGLTQNDTYNMRFFRSKNIDGPYEDIDGKNPIFYRHGNNDRLGNRLMGSFEFMLNQAINQDTTAYDYRVPGHNSVLYDDNGKDFIIFHTRFKDTGEAHEVRVHQLFFNEEGWPMIAPQRYNDETILNDPKDITGTYLIVRQEQDNAKLSKTSIGITLEKDGTIGGQQRGSWEFKDGGLSVTLGTSKYTGVILEQNTPITGNKTDYTFTLIGENGRATGDSVLGIRISTLNEKELLNKALEDITPPRLDSIQANIKLPTQSYGGINVKWSSSEPKVISSTGKVTRQDKPTALELSAKLSYGSNEVEKTFNVSVVGKDGTELKKVNTNLLYGVLSLSILAGVLSFFKIVRTRRNKV